MPSECWRTLALSEVAEVNPRRKLARGTQAQFLEMAAVSATSATPAAPVRKTFDGGGARFTNGDTLLARITPCAENGKTALVSCLSNREVGFGSTEFIVLAPRSGVSDATFVYQLVKWSRVRDELLSRMEGTSGRQRIPARALDDVRLQVPPLAEQRKIASILSSVDESIEKTEAVIAQLDVVKKAMIEDLLTRGIPGRHSRFKQTEVGEVPEEWQTRTLDDLSAPGSDICYGVVQPGPEVTGGVLLIRGGDFPDGRLNQSLLRTISPSVSEQFQRTRLRGGEVLVALVGKPGSCAVVPPELAGANVARQAAVIRPSKVIRAQFLRLFLSSAGGQRGMLGHQVGSVQRVINIRDMKKVLVAVPTLDEQDAISAPLLACEAWLASERDNLDSLRHAKRALAESLLTGSTRVKP